MLRIADNLELPLDAVTQKLAFLGRTGSGKTYAAMKLCEQMLEHHAQVVVLDPVGVWYGLRLPAANKDSGFEIPVFGGLHGDVPIEPGAGALIADLVADRGISSVLDMSQLLSSEQARFATDFATCFFQRKKAAPSAVHLFVEECQEFCPQNTMRGEERMLHAFERLIKLGRNFGIGASLISQRPQEVNKKALNQTECLFAFQMTGLQERKAIEAWVADKGLAEDLASLLPRLVVGQPHVWSPQWLRISETVHILPKRTFDASSTPKVGTGPVAPPALSPVDLEQIRVDMAAAIERAKEEDPAELHRRIAELQRAVTAAERDRPSPEIRIETVEVPVLPADDVLRLCDAIREFAISAAAIAALGEALKRAALDITDALGGATERITVPGPATARPLIAPVPQLDAKVTEGTAPDPNPLPPSVKSGGTRAGSSVDKVLQRASADRVPAPQQKVLDAIAWWETVGIPIPTRLQVGFAAGYSASGGAFGNYLGALRTAGLIDYPAAGVVALTAAGRTAAIPLDMPRTRAALHSAVLSRLPRPQFRILEFLCSVYPNQVVREVVADSVEMAHTGGAFSNYLGALRTLGLITYPARGWARAADVLFPRDLPQG